MNEQINTIEWLLLSAIDCRLLADKWEILYSIWQISIYQFCQTHTQTHILNGYTIKEWKQNGILNGHVTLTLHYSINNSIHFTYYNKLANCSILWSSVLFYILHGTWAMYRAYATRHIRIIKKNETFEKKKKIREEKKTTAEKRSQMITYYYSFCIYLFILFITSGAWRTHGHEKSKRVLTN